MDPKSVTQEVNFGVTAFAVDMAMSRD